MLRSRLVGNIESAVAAAVAAAGGGSSPTGTFSTSVITPLLKTDTAVDVVFQRNNVETLRLTSTGATVTGVMTATSSTAPLYGTTTAADVVFQRNSVEVARLSSTGLGVAVGKVAEVYGVGSPGATNYERMSLRWSGTTGLLQIQVGGTGVSRPIQILTSDGSGLGILDNGAHTLNGSSGGNVSLSAGSDTVGLSLFGKTTTGAQCVYLGNNTFGSSWNASSGLQAHLFAQADIHQSGSAQFAGIVSNVNPVATGSGKVSAFAARRNTTEIWSIDAKADLSADGDTVMFLATRSSGATQYTRVTLGAADSGGTGFRLLRVPN